MSVSHLLVAALLAFGGATEAKKDKDNDRIMFSKFMGNDCNGHPDGKKIELRKDQCVNFAADGIRIHPYNKNKHSGWLKKVNAGEQECFVTLYKGLDCKEDAAEHSVPSVFGEQCLQAHQPSSSVRFSCDSVSWSDDEAYNVTLTRPATSYSIGPGGRVTAMPYDKVITSTRYLYNNEHNGISTDAAVFAVPESEPTEHPVLAPRKKQEYNVLGLWMRHPFVNSLICYKCWTKKELDFGSLKCRSGPKYRINCGPIPNQASETSLAHTTSTRTLELWYTTAHAFTSTRTISQEPTTATPVLERRSSHTPVVLKNPYIPRAWMCADAEWENEGKQKAEVRLQHFSKHNEKSKCWKKGFVPLDVDHQPAHVNTETVYATVTSTLSTRPPWATEAH